MGLAVELESRVVGHDRIWRKLTGQHVWIYDDGLRRESTRDDRIETAVNANEIPRTHVLLDGSDASRVCMPTGVDGRKLLESEYRVGAEVVGRFHGAPNHLLSFEVGSRSA